MCYASVLLNGMQPLQYGHFNWKLLMIYLQTRVKLAELSALYKVEIYSERNEYNAMHANGIQTTNQVNF